MNEYEQQILIALDQAAGHIRSQIDQRILEHIAVAAAADQQRAVNWEELTELFNLIEKNNSNNQQTPVGRIFTTKPTDTAHSAEKEEDPEKAYERAMKGI